MKKVIAIISILFLLMGCTSVYATSQVNEVAQSTTGKIIEIKDKELKTLEVRDKGFALMIASVTIEVICQVLPLVFAIVVKGWRG